MSATAQSLVGAVLSKRFKLNRLIGEGGMGAVYAAEAIAPLSAGSGKYPLDAKTFAIKILRPEFLGEVDVLGRFIEEGRTCQRLIHPNILRVYESAQAEEGTPYIVMELLEGVPLSAYTANGGRVPLQQAITILQGILAGLAAAHAQSIVHRDLKPENVFLAREAGGQFQIKLLDFGIAKVMDAAGGMGSRTRTGALLGTPAYMSPEQIKDPRGVDPRSDLWSAAVMTWEMLTGRVAFPAPTEYARLAAVMTITPDTVDKVDPNLAPIAPVLARAMQKDMALRFGSALEMARALPVAMHDGAPRDPAGPITGTDAPSYAHVTPLSRLPVVPSVFAPISGFSPGASSERHTPAAPEMTQPAPEPKAPGGTLQSATPGVLHSPLPHPNVIVVEPRDHTMPSKDLPVLDAPDDRGVLFRSVAAWVVIILVIAALGAGFVLGIAVARSM
jgi:serine/threonine protein kinase